MDFWGIADDEAIGSITTTKLSPAFASLLVGPIRTYSVRLCDIYLTFVNRLATMFAREPDERIRIQNRLAQRKFRKSHE